jgi:hypothetical protein
MDTKHVGNDNGNEEIRYHVRLQLSDSTSLRGGARTVISSCPFRILIRTPVVMREIGSRFGSEVEEIELFSNLSSLKWAGV